MQLSAPPTLHTVMPFCPTKQVCQVGTVALDHVQLLNLSLDWPGILTNHFHSIVMCNITTALLAQLPKGIVDSRLINRWEFQQEAWLDKDESSLLIIIKSKLNI